MPTLAGQMFTLCAWCACTVCRISWGQWHVSRWFLWIVSVSRHDSQVVLGHVVGQLILRAYGKHLFWSTRIFVIHKSSMPTLFPHLKLLVQITQCNIGDSPGFLVEIWGAVCSGKGLWFSPCAFTLKQLFSRMTGQLLICWPEGPGYTHCQHRGLGLHSLSGMFLWKP